MNIGIEGARLVEEALRSDIKVEAILVSESGRKHLGKIIPRIGRETRLLATSDALFQSIAATETPQGVAAIVWPRRAVLDDLYGGSTSAQSPAKANKSTLIVVLVGLQDPGNVGTILRTSEASGCDWRRSVPLDQYRHRAHFLAESCSRIGGRGVSSSRCRRNFHASPASANARGWRPNVGRHINSRRFRGYSVASGFVRSGGNFYWQRGRWIAAAK